MKFLLPFLLLFSVSCATSPSLFERTMINTPHWEWDYTPTKGNDREDLFKTLKGRLESWGYTVEFFGEDPEEKKQGWGYHYLNEKLIEVRTAMYEDGKRVPIEVNAQMEILAHEAGHIFQPRYWASEYGHRGEGEVFAELVAQGFMTYFGEYEYLGVSNRYLLFYKSASYVEKWFKKDIQMAWETLAGLRGAPKFKD